MATNVQLRKILDRPQWELVSFPASGINSGKLSSFSTQFDQFHFWCYGTFCALYDSKQDSWIAIPACPVSLTVTGAIAYHPAGPTGTATAGASTSISTALTVPGSLAGYTIRITGGTGAGQDQVILRNTYGANAVITTAQGWNVTPDNTSTFTIMSGRFWCLNTAPAMYYYDVGLNTWSTARNVTGITQVVGGALVATPGFGNTVASGTATSGSATTLVNTGKNWAVNQWANYQVRIIGGTGMGKTAVITSNTATTLTFPTVTTALDNTSIYVLEANDDALYLGNGLNTYKYTISGNTWSTLTPGVARTTALANGDQISFIAIASDASWADETNIKNGRYLYSFTANGNLSAYDIAANTWVNYATGYGRGGGAAGLGINFVVGTNTSFCVDREFIYFMNASLPGVGWRFNAVTNNLDAWTTFALQSTASQNYNYIGKPGLCLSTYTDGGTSIRWIYFMYNLNLSSPADFYYRQLII